MRNYRISARLALWGLCFIASFAILEVRVVFVNPWFIVELALLVSALTSFFVSVAGSAA